MLNKISYIIERGIPVEPAKSGKQLSYKYAFIERMQAGDSVLLPDVKEANKVMNAMRFRKVKAVMRSVEGGVRVWRVA